MRPVIGITCCYETEKNQYQLNRDYVDAVHFSGGIPLILPHYQDAAVHIILEAIDGLLLSGGGDIDPALFCEEPWPENGDIDPHRDTFELALTAGAIAAEMPVLGICRGIQVINVAGGGSVCQDIGRVIQHPYKHDQQAPRWHPTHGIHIKHDSRLFDILGQEKLQVNSFHHQMVGTLARGFKITASSGDGVTEALEQQKNGIYCIGLQFHPENMFREHPVFLNLFESFVVACSRFMSNKNALMTQENGKLLSK